MYKKLQSGGYEKVNFDGSTTSFSETNTEYTEYLKWLDEGNTPEPADPIPEPVKSKKEKGIEKLKAATTIAQIKAALLEAFE